MTFDNNFNLLRVIGATFVIISHSYDVTNSIESEPLLMITNGHLSFSAIGLYIFFFISGLLVTKSAIFSNNWRSFFAKRALRIYPALIAVVLLSTFVIGPLFSKLSTEAYFSSYKTWDYLITSSGFRIKYLLPGLFESSHQKSTNASLWTISLELKLYFLLGLFTILNVFRNKGFYSILCLFLIAICLGTFFIDSSKMAPTLQPTSMKLITMFFIGSFFAVKQIRGKFLLLASLAGLTLFILKTSNVYRLPLPLGELLLFSSLTYFIGYQAPILKIRNDISYGLYLIAFPIQQVVFLLSGLQQNALINMIIALLISMIYALGSWHFIEKPSLVLKGKFK